jgi:F-type H+-transporting ATPase subunit epsilon
MKNDLTLEILSPLGTAYTGTIKQVSVPTPQGEITVLPNHSYLYTKMIPGEIKVIPASGKEVSIAANGGFLEVGDNLVKILSDYAVRADTINTAEAERAKKEAEKVLQEKRENVDFELEEKNLQRALLELDVADKLRRRHRS